MLARSRITSKYQVTIPKEVRQKARVRPGEVVSVEAISQGEIRLKRYRTVDDPLKVLIGTKEFRRNIPIEELEESVEAGE